MHVLSLLFSLLAAAVAVSAIPKPANIPPTQPSLDVPRCPKVATARFSKSVPEQAPFPQTAVDLCWEPNTLQLTFKAFEERNFYFDPKQRINDDIWMYEVMEAFIHHGRDDPQTYLEFEVNPNNVTYQAFVYNPSKVRKQGAPFDHFFITDPIVDGIIASTDLDRKAELWVSKAQIPLALFNVDNPRDTWWRMNFFRTVTSPETLPNQQLGAWSSPDKANFHITPFFGDVHLV
ncbi:hypothetical protein LOZ65_000323 [Ophidiomyces ophidiicola]|nr:hypothetical protein LOZ65_000323 [Ophidiomyces ophidiicola]